MKQDEAYTLSELPRDVVTLRFRFPDINPPATFHFLLSA